MQLSFLPVAIPEAGLPRSFHGTEAVMPWDSRGHIAALARSHHRASAVIPWDSYWHELGLAWLYRVPSVVPKKAPAWPRDGSETIPEWTRGRSSNGSSTAVSYLCT